MYKIGLCSVTFRHMTVKQVIETAKKSSISGIEWGGDRHVPPGSVERAEEVAKFMEQAKLETVSYGSYYRAGYDKNEFSFETVLDTAIELKAPAIRVWAGRLGSADADQHNRNKVVADIRRIADLATRHQITINLEYHARSLTDTPESAKRLMREIDHSNVYLYWQPAVGETIENRLKSIEIINPWLSHVHVFHWKEIERLSFEDGMGEWKQYLRQLEPREGTRYLLMEFVKNDDPEQFYHDVKNLKSLIASLK